jgi:hypothetical protein
MTKTVYPILCRIYALFQAALEPPPGSGGKYMLSNKAIELPSILSAFVLENIFIWFVISTCIV